MPLSWTVHQEPKFMFYSRKLLTPIGKHITLLNCQQNPWGCLFRDSQAHISYHVILQMAVVLVEGQPHICPSNIPFQRKQGACLHPHSVFKTVCSSAQAAVENVMNCPASTTGIYFLQPWELGGLRSGCSPVWFLVRAPSGLQMAAFFLYPHEAPRQESGGRMEGLVPSYRDVNPILRTPPSWPRVNLPKTPSLNTVTEG